jgi:hypothetical protein
MSFNCTFLAGFGIEGNKNNRFGANQLGASRLPTREPIIADDLGYPIDALNVRALFLA